MVIFYYDGRERVKMGRKNGIKLKQSLYFYKQPNKHIKYKSNIFKNKSIAYISVQYKHSLFLFINKNNLNQFKSKVQMNTPSEEQKTIIHHIKNIKNVIVDACAGSGKSTTVLETAFQTPNKNILQITYNASLRHEIKEKIKTLQLPNIQIHTFHSLAVLYYDTSSHTDTELRKIINENIPSRIDIPKIDYLFVDEAQDMTELYFKFIVKFLKDMGEKVQLLILGDYRQGLYEFKGSDIRFLTLADKIWKHVPNLSNYDFEKCHLRMSYRVTNEIAKFVNNAMLGENRLLACKSGEPVIYIRMPIKKMEEIIVYYIKKLLSEEGATPQDIFILGASVKGPNIRKLENKLVENNIPCYVPTFEGDKLDERVIEGKVVFSTFHCVKGRQRKYVIVVGFDNNYFRHFARTLDETECPNTLYVACTRATHKLFLLESDQHPTDRPLEFLKIGHPQMKQVSFIEFKGIPRTIFYKYKENNSHQLLKIHHETPTKLIKFISDSTMDIILPIIDKIFEKKEMVLPEYEEIEIPNIIQTSSGFFEDVSDLNGIAIPCIFYDYFIEKYKKNTEEEQSNVNVLYSIVENCLYEMKENEHMFLKSQLNYLVPEDKSPNDYLFLANLFTSIREQLYFKLKQIKLIEYNWLSKKVLDQCKHRLDTCIGMEYEKVLPTFEVTIIHNSLEEEHKNIDKELRPYFEEMDRFRFSAVVDTITEKTVWELKCTSITSIDHKLQLIIYAWLWKVLEKPTKNFKLLNIKTGELYVLDATKEELTQIIVALLKGKYEEYERKTDKEFLESCHHYVDELYK